MSLIAVLWLFVAVLTTLILFVPSYKVLIRVVLLELNNDLIVQYFFTMLSRESQLISQSIGKVCKGACKFNTA